MTKAQFHIFSDPAAVAEAVANHLASAIQDRPELTLGLATGKTFLPIYGALVARMAAEKVSLAQAASFNLDEYVGLPAGHPASFRRYMQDHFFSHVDLPAARGLLPGVEGDLEAACRDYEAAIAARGGIDLQLLGIGRNGHIGFNEPGAAFDGRTHVETLTASTIAANKSDFPSGEVPPPQAVTMGIGTILEARQIVLVAIGAAKAEALRAAFDRTPSPDCPASALQAHADVLVFCDAAARPGAQ